MKYRKILLAYNGSQEGKRALLECADLAGFLQAETHLLAVASMPPSLFLTEGFVPEELLEEEKKRTQTVLDEGIRTLRERGFNATGHLAVGEPVEEICRLAKASRVDLIVVGHNQNTSFAARWWKGSVGASLLDYAPCSILIAMSKVYSANTIRDAERQARRRPDAHRSGTLCLRLEPPRPGARAFPALGPRARRDRFHRQGRGAASARRGRGVHRRGPRRR